ncbi:TetR/AcrR family transcriptional regulator [Microvirga subterranea]|uniref:TetR family transcriptional regulator n=1 Tax=Microvirga subterranea TaxID=186651 RepID=A0A370HJV3_9HYPH|nr:TetR/AcrR family transcriptional regulator [Microvirga subterranea]RDI58630.1 TetR family transcriptional regulator [Microvirga subterranea]
MAERTRAARVRTNDPGGLRRRLVDAAFEAFATRGYHATSVHDLKRAAGATGGALAHHFPSKKDLGLAVLQDRVADAVEETWIRPVLSARTAADGISAVFTRIADELDRQGCVSGCPLSNLALELSRHDDDFRRLIDAVFVRWRAAVAEKIRTDQEAGLLEGLDPEAFATLVVASYSGAMAMAKAAQDAQALRICAEELSRAMQPRSASLR